MLVPDHWQNGKATVSKIERAELAEAHTPVLIVENNQNLSWSEEELVVVKEQPKLANGNLTLEECSCELFEGAARLCNFV